VNVWTFTGRLGADGELRTTQSGERVLSFRAANDVGFGDRKTTQWVECSMWGKRAEAVAPHLKKGQQVVVSGELTIHEFERRDGSKASGLRVRVNDVTLVGGKPEGQGDHDEKASAPARPRPTETAPRHDDLDDDIPF